MVKINLKHIEIGIRFFLTKENHELRMGEKLVLITIFRLFDDKQVITKNDVCIANMVKRDTTYHLILSLEKKGYLESKRSGKFFSPSYIILKKKALLYSLRLKENILL